MTTMMIVPQELESVLIFNPKSTASVINMAKNGSSNHKQTSASQLRTQNTGCLNPFAALLAALSLGKRPVKCQIWNHYGFFCPLLMHVNGFLSKWQYRKQICYKTVKYTVCRRALFSPEILQAWAVKGLRHSHCHQSPHSQLHSHRKVHGHIYIYVYIYIYTWLHGELAAWSLNRVKCKAQLTGIPVWFCGHHTLVYIYIYVAPWWTRCLEFEQGQMQSTAHRNTSLILWAPYVSLWLMKIRGEWNWIKQEDKIQTTQNSRQRERRRRRRKRRERDK